MALADLGFLRGESGPGIGKKTLFDRASGRFYTPELIGRNLARTLVGFLSTRVRIRAIDPFCGDGRLMRWVLEEAAARPTLAACEWDVDLWDRDADALEGAVHAVRSAARQTGVTARVEGRTVDTFDWAPSHFGEYDLVTTNPPWEVLKPDRRELDLLPPDQAELYLKAIREQSDRLGWLYPASAPLRRWSGWGVNLARTGTEAALRLAAADGVVGVVSPATLLADQTSMPLRSWMLHHFQLREVEYYPAEARLFDGVDQPCLALVASPGKGDVNLVVRRYDPDRKRLSDWSFRSTLTTLEATGYALPIQLGPDAPRLLDLLSGFPRFGELEDRSPRGLWAGRELDETGYRRFLVPTGDHPFAKGRMIRRYGLADEPTMSVSPSGPRLPPSVAFSRIAWRDVSRPNQRRRMQATLIPPGWATGNSLSVAHFRDGSTRRLKTLLAILNSAVFEFQMRTHLATAHVSLSTVRLCHIPMLDEEAQKLLGPLVDARLEGREAVEGELERAVAALFGLDSELPSILKMLGDASSRSRRRS